ncbi:hypothetical protein vseg_005990 [Gypsophila vaccaria]
MAMFPILFTAASIICMIFVLTTVYLIEKCHTWLIQRQHDEDDIERAVRTVVHAPVASSMVYFFDGAAAIRQLEAAKVEDEVAVVVIDEEVKNKVAQSCIECVVCLENFDDQEVNNNNYFIGPCGHRFHEECIRPWLIECNVRSCPICRCFISIIDHSLPS